MYNIRRENEKFLENKIFTKFCENFLEWTENTTRRRKQHYDLAWKKEITTDERVAKTFSFSHFPIASFLAVIIISLRNIHMEGRNERWREKWLSEHGWELERLTNNTAAAERDPRFRGMNGAERARRGVRWQKRNERREKFIIKKGGKNQSSNFFSPFLFAWQQPHTERET